MTVLIVEDELMAREKLSRMLTTEYSDVEIIGKTSSVEESIEWLKSHNPDVIFMDVELEDGDCFEIFRQVDIRAGVVMTTAYDHYAVKAFEAGSVDYLLKPLEPAALRRAVERCRARVGKADIAALLSVLSQTLGTTPSPAVRSQKDVSVPPATQQAEHKYKERFIMRIGERIIPVNTSEIAYFYSENKSNYITVKDGSHFITDISMDALVNELDPKSFFRISRNCIVSLGSILSITRQAGGRLRITAHPDPPFEMTVSRSRVDDFLAWIE